MNTNSRQDANMSGGRVQVPGELLALIPGYLARRESDAKELKIALSKGEYETISKIGHKLKGNGAGFGFERITELGAIMQTIVSENRFDELPQVISDFEQEISNLKKMF